MCVRPIPLKQHKKKVEIQRWPWGGRAGCKKLWLKMSQQTETVKYAIWSGLFLKLLWTPCWVRISFLALRDMCGSRSTGLRKYLNTSAFSILTFIEAISVLCIGIPTQKKTNCTGWMTFCKLPLPHLHEFYFIFFKYMIFFFSSLEPYPVLASPYQIRVTGNWL